MNYTTTMDSPVGRIRLVSDGTALTALLFEDSPGTRHLPGPWLADDAAAPFPQARRELAEYFAGRRTVFEIPLAPRGTPFEKRVWEALRRIPHGTTSSYGDVARAVGSPRGCRAVGAANRRNPLAIVVPCHRVIGADGSLTGYAAGVTRKKALLEREEGFRASGPGA